MVPQSGWARRYKNQGGTVGNANSWLFPLEFSATNTSFVMELWGIVTPSIGREKRGCIFGLFRSQ